MLEYNNVQHCTSNLKFIVWYVRALIVQSIYVHAVVKCCLLVMLVKGERTPQTIMKTVTCMQSTCSCK